MTSKLEVWEGQWLTPIIPDTLEVEIGRIAVQGQQGQRVVKTSSQPTSCAWQCMMWFQLCGRHKKEDCSLRAALDKVHKKAGSMARVAEFLPSKCGVWSSNSYTTNNI
jgi:hypothetical protein